MPFVITYNLSPQSKGHCEVIHSLTLRVTPDIPGTWCLMMSSSRTLEVRPTTSFPTVQSLRR